MSQVNYSEMVSKVRGAFKADKTQANRWAEAGRDVAAFYHSADALLEVKAQFMADAIIPELDKKHQDALLKDLPRKGSKAYNEMNEANQALWASATKAKADAKATAHTMFKRVMDYAFPPVKEEKEDSATASDLTKIIEHLTAALKKCEKSEELECDAAALHNGIVMCLKIANA